MTDTFRANANALFGFKGTEQQARTTPGWLSPAIADALWSFCLEVAQAYATALSTDSQTSADDLATDIET